MRVLPTIVLLILIQPAFSQARYPDFSRIDREVEFIDAKDPASLSRLLTANCGTEPEKVRAIFRWISGHISYYRATPANRRRSKPAPDQLEESDTLLPLTERVAIKVLQDRRTHCEGYARLFKSLCDHAGITAAIISGYARTENGRPSARFRSNHTWNAVYVDSVWRLIDVTWASGYITYSSENFVSSYNEYYFFTPPEQFAEHHYPDDLRWTLLAEPPAISEFRRTPYKQRSFAKYAITDFTPSRGIIEAMVGDTLRFELESTMITRASSIAPDSLWDSASLLHTPVYAYVEPEATLKGNKIQYIFPVESEKVLWLHVMYNHDAVLRYRLDIRKKDINNGNISGVNY